jgi:Zn-dependent peptidase ImmA (M78 family)/plasmid maintenance system antidote protein VapI
MEHIQSINTDRIAWCCADHGITPSELAFELGIAATSMERLMAGEDSISFYQLRKISDYFGKGVLFFLETGSIDETMVHTPQFRTLANIKPELSYQLKSLIEPVEKQREIYISLLEELEETDRPGFNPPNLPRQNPQQAANIARKWLGLKVNNNFSDYRAAVEAKGILVFRSNGYSGQWQIPKENPILGFALYFTNWPVIVIKKQSWETQQTFTLMHELGHLLLQEASSIDDEGDFQSSVGKEREANAFAGHLLVPDAFLATIHDSERPSDVSLFDEWLEQQRHAWGVSGEVILRRLLDTGRLSHNQYMAYRQWRAQLPITSTEGGSRMYRYREPMHIFGDIFVRTVLDAMNARKVTLTKGSSYLDGLKIQDLHKLERYYAGF